MGVMGSFLDGIDQQTEVFAFVFIILAAYMYIKCVHDLIGLPHRSIRLHMSLHPAVGRTSAAPGLLKMFYVCRRVQADTHRGFGTHAGCVTPAINLQIFVHKRTIFQLVRRKTR